MIDYLRNSKWLLGIFALILVVSCSSDDDGDDEPTPPQTAAPTISIDGETSINAKAGETFSVTLNLDAEAGNKELVVSTNGGVLEVVTLTADATSFEYNTQSVPAESTEGQEYQYQFVLVDSEDRESSSVTLTISAELYDQLAVGTETLYNVTIPQDGIVTGDILFTSGRNYLVAEPLLFDIGSSLTIQEGVAVYMEVPTEVDEPRVEISLVPGATLTITGSATSPVVMTPTSVLTGDPSPGDWNRLKVGETNAPLTNSTIRYLRTEYADDGLRLVNLDNSNTVEFIQTFKSDDEGFYITDGTVNAKYLVATDSKTNGFRLGDAYEGKLQFGITHLSEVLEAEEYAIEIREDSKALLANFTLLGAGQDTEDEMYGLRLRAASDARVYNTAVASFTRRGVRVNEETPIGGTLEGPTVFAYSYVFDIREQHYRDAPFGGTRNPDDGSVVNPFFNNTTGFNEVDDGMGGTVFEPIYEVIAGIGVNDFIPDATVTALENHDPSSVDAFFESVTFVGAIENEGSDWTTGWVKNTDGSIR